MSRFLSICAIVTGGLVTACGPGEANDKNTAPVLRLRSPVIAPAGVPVTFDARGSEDDQGVVAWKASFGDGQAENALSGALFTHVFEIPSNYEVRVQAFDAQGARDTLIRHITVVQNYWPPYCDEISPCEEAAYCEEGVCFLDGDQGSL